MIPMKLALRNFLCYRDNVEPLDFSGIHLACLSGENGHGKSALLDAITWVLWGKARASTDELIHFGEVEMEVEFEFALGEQVYRVIRKRDRRNRGQTQLELQVRVDGAYHPLTERTQRDTQAKIIELLRMDYETFINSAFLLQGRADEFTTKTPMERKQILAEILGLSRYDAYEEKAKERARAKDSEAKLAALQIEEWERELALRPQYEQELAEAQDLAACAAERLRELDQQAQQLRRERQELEGVHTQLQEVRTRLERARGDLADLHRRLDEGRRRMVDYERILADRTRIEEGYRELQSVRQQHEQLNLKLQEVMKLNQRQAELEAQIGLQRQELLLQKQRLEVQIAGLEQKTAERRRWEAELQEMAAPLQHLTEVEEGLPGLRDQLNRCAEDIARLRAQAEQLDREIEEIEENRRLLSAAGAECPLCNSALTEGHRRRVLKEMEERKAEKERARRSVDRQLAGLAERRDALQAEVRRAEKQLGNLPGLHARRARLESALEEVGQAESALAELRPQLDAVQGRIARADWAAEARSQLAEVQEALRALAYDEQEHEEVRTRLAVLSGFDDERTRLLAAEGQLVQERAHLEELERFERQLREDAAAAERQEQELAGQLGRWDECLAELDEVERRLLQQQADEAQARQKLGAARQKLDACDRLEDMRARKLKERDALLQEKAIYDELRLAFSKRGVQAMVIEHAVPEVEDEANAILFRMTDGQMQVKLDTQKETKAKDVVETLEITVSDALGPRSYELYSGGEAFRINFALRVALSKLLARRAGASLQTLVIDEGFGTQDAQGRERLIDAINSIQDDFEKVLVITHIDELRDAFPVRIDVFKTASGSQIMVN